MTDARHDPDSAVHEPPRDPWLVSLARDATDVHTDAIPREMMWARIQQRRRATPVAPTLPGMAVPDMSAPTPLHVMAPTGTPSRRRTWMWRAAGIAAVLVGGIGVGRYLIPVSNSTVNVASTRADSITALGLGPDALAAMPRSDDPAHVAMEEHLARTVALLTKVRNEDPVNGPASDLSSGARELLGTTRLLLDEPRLRDERTRRLLQDLELVLVQITYVRGSAPATQRAPSETMRETNLLPRVRAAVTASRRGDDPILGGGL